jgi:ectoine hydroxylase-related dioxygenase (phytanoyl-CoA dioxygenase family)
MAFYLDPVTRDSGCLRVIPGSHKLHDKYADAVQDVFVSSRENMTEEQFGISGSEVPAMALETVPGDLLMFNHRIKHSSWGGSDRRRMFTMNFQQRFREEDLDELREDVGQRARFWVEQPYGELLVRTASPQRMAHLEQWLANADHLPALAAKAREEMDEPARG